ncbi:MAG: hypothetical protein JO236_16170 [Mycobacterium sp.]|uniref:hypothetical protein n=1 Tax=Mycobacterium sp. TaxID=1785 RepID=UPI001EBFBCE5|nr:hypothetical protein [Mycobacterium sp.]MBW0019065.1 hypothetical protein [Mycobacterium sp.]
MASDNATAPARRYSAGVVIGTGLAGLALGEVIAFAITGLTFKVRVELPSPAYPQLSSTPSVSAPPLPSVTSSAVPVLPQLPHP